MAGNETSCLQADSTVVMLKGIVCGGEPHTCILFSESFRLPGGDLFQASQVFFLYGLC